MMNSGSDQPSLPTRCVPRLVALDDPPERYVIDVELNVSDTADAEQLVQLYWVVDGMQPILLDLDEEQLHARFRRYAPSAEVAAWALTDEIRALPGARLTRVGVSAANGVGTELVLTTANVIAAVPNTQDVAA